MTAIRNPADKSIGHVPQEAFESHWKYLGWEEVTDDEVKVLTIVNNVSDEPVGTLDDLNRDDLLAAAERAGVAVKRNAKKDDIIGQLRAAAENGVADATPSQEG